MSLRSYQEISPVIGNSVYIDPDATVIGDVRIGDDSSVWPRAVIRGDVHHIQIGERTSVQDGAVLHVTHDGPFSEGGFPLIIGSEVTIGHQVMLHGCTIGDRVLIGMSAIIMDGAVIEGGVIIGAGSLVPPGKVLEAGHLYVGRPVVKKRALTESERSFFKYQADRYVHLAAEYLLANQAPDAEHET